MRIIPMALSATAAVALLAGCGSTDPTTTPQYHSLQSQLATAQKSIAALQGQVDQDKATIGDLPQMKKSLEAEKTALKSQATKLASQAKSIKSQQAQINKTLDNIQANTVPGDGTWHVGQDMAAGTYHSTGNSDCYWQISSDPNGNNIIANNNVTGPAFVSVAPGQYFESQMCSKWIKE